VCDNNSLAKSADADDIAIAQLPKKRTPGWLNINWFSGAPAKFRTDNRPIHEMGPQAADHRLYFR